MNVYDFTVKDISGKEVSLKDYEGKVLLIVNTATKCGLTPQYKALQEIYEKYKDKGFEILDFPCNQFLEQAPGSDKELEQFCQLNYGTTFKTFAKIDVNGENTDPLYKGLKKSLTQEKTDENENDFIDKVKDFLREKLVEDIKWNFTKFLVNRNGKVVDRFSPVYNMEKIKFEIEKLL